MNRTNRSGAIAALFPEVKADEVGVSATFIPHADHEGQPGWVQGGFIATVLDYVCAYMATETFGAQAITGNLTIRYGAPMLLKGGPFEVKAELDPGLADADGVVARRTLRVNGLVIDPGGERIVTASGLFVRRISTS